MSTTRPRSAVLGRCPGCGAEIAGRDVIIEYETGDGRPALWTGCPACGDVVDPE